MNLIEALQKYEKVTCDEIIEECGIGEYISRVELDSEGGLICRCDNKYDNCLYFNWLRSNSYREWKE